MALLSRKRPGLPTAIVFAAVLFVTPAAQAATIYESGILGQTGITESQLNSGEVAGTNVNEFIFVGVRFELVEQFLTTAIGGHFASSPGGGSYFGAIVALDGPEDLPDSSNLSTPDVIGTTTMLFPHPSADVMSSLSIRLEPGWYALVFGSGLFGAQGAGASVRNNADIGSPDYIGRGTAGIWDAVPILAASGQRFVVEGFVIPEPNTLSLASLLIFAGSACQRCRRNVGTTVS